MLLLIAAVLSGLIDNSAGADTAGTATAATQPVNDRCPVMTDELASPLHEITFRGGAVRFCCRHCKDRFLLQPQRYVARLPHVPAADRPATNPSASPGNRGRRGITFEQVIRWMETFVEGWRPYLIIMLALGVCQLWAARHVRRRAAAAGSSATVVAKRSVVARTVAFVARPSTLLVGVLAVMVVRQWSVANVAAEPAAAAAHDTSAQPHAVAVAKVVSNMARQGILQGAEFVGVLEKTYYRGNDERAPMLFNGGAYRTCTFHLGLRTEDGEPVTAGRNVDGQRLFVRLEIQRAPGALASHFNDTDMSASRLVPHAFDPSADAGTADGSDGPGGRPALHPFVVLDPGNRWAAGCPVGRVTPGQSVQRFDGVVLLTPATGADVNPDGAWAEAHYGIQYNLRVENGVVTPSSKLWMGALIFTEDLPDERLHEWFSCKPLPNIPEGFRHVGETN